MSISKNVLEIFFVILEVVCKEKKKLILIYYKFWELLIDYFIIGRWD